MLPPVGGAPVAVAETNESFQQSFSKCYFRKYVGVCVGVTVQPVDVCSLVKTVKKPA